MAKCDICEEREAVKTDNLLGVSLCDEEHCWFKAWDRDFRAAVEAHLRSRGYLRK